MACVLTLALVLATTAVASLAGRERTAVQEQLLLFTDDSTIASRDPQVGSIALKIRRLHILNGCRIERSVRASSTQCVVNPRETKLQLHVAKRPCSWS